MNCICGMVEKTQSAISILQQRQAEVSSIRGTEDLVAEVQSKATIAIMEVKQAALEEIRKAEAERNKKVSDVQTNSKEEVISLSLAILFNNVSFLPSSPAGTVVAQLPRPVLGVAWQDTADHSASTRTGRSMPGSAGQTSPWRITLVSREDWLDHLQQETEGRKLHQGRSDYLS